MTDQPIRSDETAPNPDDAGILDWLRWWHWLILGTLLLGGMFYFPLWRFDLRWNSIQVGDSFDSVRQKLGEPRQNVTRRGAIPSGPAMSYTYSRYWRSYEVEVDPDTQIVVGLIDFRGSASAAAPSRGQVQPLKK